MAVFFLLEVGPLKIETRLHRAIRFERLISDGDASIRRSGRGGGVKLTHPPLILIIIYFRDGERALSRGRFRIIRHFFFLDIIAPIYNFNVAVERPKRSRKSGSSLSSLNLRFGVFILVGVTTSF